MVLLENVMDGEWACVELVNLLRVSLKLGGKGAVEKGCIFGICVKQYGELNRINTLPDIFWLLKYVT